MEGRQDIARAHGSMYIERSI